MARKYALFVGNSEYDSEGLINLDAPLADVRGLAQVFRDSDIGGFDEVTELINSTESEIRQKISGFFLHKKPTDLLLLYFSGHGVLDDRGHLYLAVKDTQPNLLRATSISADFIADDMDLCRSKRQILILDCCHSGAFRRGIKADNQVLTATTFEGNGSGRIVLTASDRREFAMEGNQVLQQAKTSLFTHFLLEGIRSGEADQDGDSLISLDEWYDYAYQKVVEKLPTQTPRRWVYNQEGKLIIARNPCPVKPTELPKDLQEAVADAAPSVRIDAITALAEILHGPDKRMSEAAHKALKKLQKDDHADVQEAAKKIFRTITPVLDMPRPDSAPPKITTKETYLGWKKWLVAAAVIMIVGLLGWELYQPNDNDSSSDGSDPLATEQTDSQVTGAGLDGGDIDLPPDKSSNEQTLDEQQTTPVLGADETSEKQDMNPAVETSTLPGRAPEEVKQEEADGGGQNTGTVQGDEISNEGQDASTNPLGKGSPTASGEDLSEQEAGAGEHNFPNAEERPIQQLQSEIGGIQNTLKEAIMKGEFGGLPAPLADSYGKDLQNLYGKFNVVAVDMENGELQTDGSTALMPVTVIIKYRQKGRDFPTNEIPTKSEWVWSMGTEGFVLDTVQRL